MFRRLAEVAPSDVATTIITYEEQTRGWMAYLAKCRTLGAQVEAYRRLEKHLTTFRRILVLGFTEPAAVEYQRLARLKHKCGTMDLRIAAITLSLNATLLTRNQADFSPISGLRTADWTK